MAKILKNTTGSAILISDTGISVPAAPATYTIVSNDYPLWAASSDIVTYVGSGDIIINDGTFDLSKADSISLLQGNFKQTDFIADLKESNRLKVDVQFTGDQLIKVSSDDLTAGYLEAKVVEESGATTVTTLNPGGAETLQIGLPSVGVAGTKGSATQVPVFTTDAKGRVTASTDTTIAIPASQVTDFNEAAQDAVGTILVDSSSVDLTYNDGANTISATVLPAGVDHNSLANLTTGDPHTQYVKDAGTVTDNAIVRYDGTDGRTIQNSSVQVFDDGKMSIGGSLSPISELEVRTTSSASNRGISSLQYSNDINGGKLSLGKARGTTSSPLYPVNTDVIGVTNFKAWDEATSSWSNVGYYNVNASENHTATAKGTNIGFWTTTNGTTTPSEKVQVTNTGRVVLTNAITLSNTTETVDGTFRWTGSEAQVNSGSNWMVLGLNATSLTGSSSVTTTSATYSTISGMTTTPTAGTYLLSFNCNSGLASDTSADIAVFVGGVEQTIFTRRLSIDAAGVLGATASYEVVFSTISFVTVNGSQVVDIRFRENGSGTLTITERVLTLIPASRPE